jgi:hypothetical protein
MDIESLRREVRLLRGVVVALLAVSCVGLIAAAAAGWPNGRFNEITVHRINVVDDNGTLRLAISNAQHMPPPIMHGKPLKLPRSHVNGNPSFIFYNALGDEQGGYIWGSKGDYPAKYSQFTYLSSDQFEQNDSLGLSYEDDGPGRRFASLEGAEQAEATPVTTLIDQMFAAMNSAKTPAERTAIEKQFAMAHFKSYHRFFVGYNPDGSMVKLYDTVGRPRLVMIVQPDGTPKIQFLDAKGKVTYQIPSSQP